MRLKSLLIGLCCLMLALPAAHAQQEAADPVDAYVDKAFRGSKTVGGSVVMSGFQVSGASSGRGRGRNVVYATGGAHLWHSSRSVTQSPPKMSGAVNAVSCRAPSCRHACFLAGSRRSFPWRTPSLRSQSSVSFTVV